jgi:putative ABC transport system permease protein
MTSRPDAPDYLWHGHSVTWLRLLARRKPDVPTEQARAGFEAIYARIRAEMARGLQTAYRKTILGSRVEVLDASSGSSALRERLSAPLVVLTAIVGLVLLIACANVATLMLARVASRSRQMAVCIAIGASRTRLIRQGLMEVVLLAAAGGSAGLVFALWGTRALTALTSGALPVSIDASPDWRVFLFAVLLSGVTALIVGLLPVLRSARLDPLPELKVSGTRSQTVARILLGRSLVVIQIAVSLVLLLAAGLFTRSLLKLQAIDPGFDADRVLLLLVTPPLEDRFDPELHERLIARAERVPGVDAASLSSTGVFNRGTWGNTITVEGFVARGDSTPRTFVNAVSNKYFTVMRIPVLRGRGFTEFDRSTSPKVALVNDAFVRQFFGQTNPLGKRVGLCSSSPCAVDPANLMAIVGVTKDAKLTNLREGRQPMLYLPSAQHTATLRELEVHTVGDAESVVTTLRRELAAVDPRLATSSAIELREHVNASLVAERLTAKLSALFGLLALALGAIGLYGVIAYMTVQRTSEIGLRIALGADGARVRRLVVRDIVWLVGLGALVGLPVAFAGARLVEHQLYGITATDPLSVIAALCALAAAALIAGYLPTRRATRIDPLIALRAE